MSGKTANMSHITQPQACPLHARSTHPYSPTQTTFNLSIDPYIKIFTSVFYNSNFFYYRIILVAVLTQATSF